MQEQIKEFKFENKAVNTKFLVVDESYQRPCDFARVAKMKKNFNPNLVNDVKVSLRDGVYYIFDGQHTTVLQKEMNGGKDLNVRCKVFYGMTKEDEARLFAEQNGIARQPIQAQKLRALYEAGDIDVVDMVNCIRSLGITCTLNGGGTTRNTLTCYATTYKIFIKYGENRLREVLTIILKAWGGNPESFDNRVIDGINMFLDKYEDEYSEKLLVGKLCKIPPREIINDGKSRLTGGKYRYAMPVLDIYNKNTTKNRLEYKF